MKDAAIELSTRGCVQLPPAADLVSLCVHARQDRSTVALYRHKSGSPWYVTWTSLGAFGFPSDEHARAVRMFELRAQIKVPVLAEVLSGN